MEEFAVYTEQAVPSCACGLVIPSLSSPLALSVTPSLLRVQHFVGQSYLLQPD